MLRLIILGGIGAYVLAREGGSGILGQWWRSWRLGALRVVGTGGGLYNNNSAKSQQGAAFHEEESEETEYAVEELSELLEEIRDSQHKLKGLIGECEERLRQSSERNRALKQQAMAALSFGAAPTQEWSHEGGRHAELVLSCRAGAALQRGEIGFDELLRVVLTGTYKVLRAQNIQFVVHDKPHSEEWWTFSEVGGMCQAFGRGEMVMESQRMLRRVVAPTPQLPMCTLVASDKLPASGEGAIGFDVRDDEALRVLGMELSAAVTRECFDLEMGPSATGGQGYFYHGGSGIPPLLSLLGGRRKGSSTVEAIWGGQLKLGDEDLGPVGDLACLLTWDFDLFSKSYGELECFVIDVYRVTGLASRFEISEDALRRFVSGVRHSYHDNPFHNFYHAFSVFQVSYLLVMESGAKNFLRDLDLLAVLTAALCHDADHPGVSNDFLIHTESPLSLLYNDLSVLENHHCRTAFEILLMDDQGIFRGLTQTEKTEVRRAIVSCIFGTDMRYHASYVSRMRIVAEAYQQDPDSGVPMDIEKEQDRQLLMDVLVHCADLSGQTLKHSLATEWGQRVLEEFRQQTVLEKKQGLPIAPFMMDLDDPLKQATTQKNFIGFVVEPLWKVFCAVFPEVSFLCDKLTENLEAYKRDEQTLTAQRMVREDAGKSASADGLQPELLLMRDQSKDGKGFAANQGTGGDQDFTGRSNSAS